MSLIPEAAIGSLSVLSVGRGDVEVRFDNTDPMETERAKRIIQDMLRRGYSLFIEVKGKLVPVKEFDAKREVYKIADGALDAGAAETPQAMPQPEKRGRGRPKKATAEVPMKNTKATGIAPTAGG